MGGGDQLAYHARDFFHEAACRQLAPLHALELLFPLGGQRWGLDFLRQRRNQGNALPVGRRKTFCLLFFRSMKPTFTSFSMIPARVAACQDPCVRYCRASAPRPPFPWPPEAWPLKAFVKGVRGYFSYYLRRFSLCFCLNNAFQPVLRSQTATMVKKHFDFIICFALLNHKNSIRFVFLRMVIWGG